MLIKTLLQNHHVGATRRSQEGPEHPRWARMVPRWNQDRAKRAPRKAKRARMEPRKPDSGWLSSGLTWVTDILHHPYWLIIAASGTTSSLTCAHGRDPSFGSALRCFATPKEPQASPREPKKGRESPKGATRGPGGRQGASRGSS